MLLLSGAVMAEPSTRPAVISGEIHAVDAQPILTPPSDSSPVVLRSFVAEGQPVRKGDVVLSIDGGQAASNTRQFKSERLQAAARADKEVAALEVAAIDAERKLRISEATLDKARIDAAIPREHLAALDFDRYRGALQQAERELEVARNEWTAAVSAVNRRREDRQIELAHELFQIWADNIWEIGTVGLTPMVQGVVVVNKDLMNVPDTAGNDWPLRTPGNTRPESFFYQ